MTEILASYCVALEVTLSLPTSSRGLLIIQRYILPIETNHNYSSSVLRKHLGYFYDKQLLVIKQSQYGLQEGRQMTFA